MTEPERDLWYALQNLSMVRLGLETLQEASVATDPAHRTELLLQGQTAEELRQSTFPPQLWDTLNYFQSRQDNLVVGMDGLELFMRGTSQRGEDVDSVPWEVWTWVHTGIGWGLQAGYIDAERNVHRSEALSMVRYAGLVLWDQARLQKTGVFRKDVGSWVVSQRKQRAARPVAEGAHQPRDSSGLPEEA